MVRDQHTEATAVPFTKSFGVCVCATLILLMAKMSKIAFFFYPEGFCVFSLGQPICFFFNNSGAAQSGYKKCILKYFVDLLLTHYNM